jgi:predicted enzyme related to lactoylglutathione lyase
MEVAVSTEPNASVVIFVADVRRVSSFYRGLAAMSVLNEDERHVVMERRGFELVIHALRGEPSPRRAESGEVEVREDSYVKVCLPVRSIAEARFFAASNGGAIKPPEHEWEARGFRACDGFDPEGNVIQVREAAG